MSNDERIDSDQPLTLHCIGVEFRELPAATRGTLALSPDLVADALDTIRSTIPAAEAVVLATCNRTELYVVEAGDPERLDLWHRTVGRRMAQDHCPAAEANRFHLTGSAAAEHLLRVAAGLESTELGDEEIVGQVRRARELADQARVVGPVLHRLFDLASQAGRRARAETLISAGGAGVGLATATVIAQRVPDARIVTVIGAGDAANAVCRELTKRTDASIRVVNRTRARAEELANRYAATAHGLDGLVDALAGADAVVTAVYGDSPVLDREVVRRGRIRDASWSPLVVDTCVPRMADVPADVEVVHLDDEGARALDVLRVRRAAVPEVESVVASVLESFEDWLRDRALRDVIAELFREADAVTAAAAGLVDDERAAREIHLAVRRLVHQHITRLRALGATDGPVNGRNES